MPEKIMRVEYPDGATLSQSHKKAGAFSPLTRDEENNLGHVILNDIDDENDIDEGSTDEDEILTTLGAALFVVLVIKALPPLKRLWVDRALPFLKERRSRFTGGSAADPTVDSAHSDILLDQASPHSISAGVAGPLDPGPLDPMDTLKFERVLTTLLEQYLDGESIRNLIEADTEDESTQRLIETTLAKLTPKQREAILDRLLDAAPSHFGGPTD